MTYLYRVHSYTLILISDSEYNVTTEQLTFDAVSNRIIRYKEIPFKRYLTP